VDYDVWLVGILGKDQTVGERFPRIGLNCCWSLIDHLGNETLGGLYRQDQDLQHKAADQEDPEKNVKMQI
jgi:hypothetical protein